MSEWKANKCLNYDLPDLPDKHDSKKGNKNNHDNQDNPKNHSSDILVDGLPKGWRKGSVLEIATLLSGGTPKTDVSEYWNGDINWISAKDITNSNSQFIIETEKTVTELGILKSAAKLLPKFTTITSRKAIQRSCSNYPFT